MEPGELRRLYESGLSVQEVADASGLSYGTTQRRLAAAGTTIRPLRRDSSVSPAQMRLLYEGGMTLQEVAEAAGLSYSTIQRRLGEAGATLRHGWTEAQRARVGEARRADIPEDRLRELHAQGLTSREIRDALGGRWSEEAVRAAQIRLGLKRLPAKARPGRNAFWTGGAQADKHGYILIHFPEHPGAAKNGYVRQHRLIAERMLGRPLLPGEVVDHRNGDTSDNRDENLRVFRSNGEHLRATRTGRERLSREERARVTQEAVRRAQKRVEAIREVSRSGADPSLWRYYRPTF